MGRLLHPPTTPTSRPRSSIPSGWQAVLDTGLLDSIAEESFDRLTRLAAKITGAPVAFVSLLDAHRDFYKSTFGMDAPLSTLRQLTGRTFCHYSLVSDGPLVLEDVDAAAGVPRRAHRGVPGGRAYAGIPLKTEAGQVLGSFCARWISRPSSGPSRTSKFCRSWPIRRCARSAAPGIARRRGAQPAAAATAQGGRVEPGTPRTGLDRTAHRPAQPARL